MGTTSAGTVPPEAPSLAESVHSLGERVRGMRTARGFSLLEFAQLAGVSVPAMSAFERGEPSGQIATLFAAADALELDVRELFAESATADAGEATEAAFSPQRPAEPIPRDAAARGRQEADTEVPASAAPSRYIVTSAAPSSAPPDERARVPRTFADLRVGALEGRSFATLPEFAVAAVVEGGHPPSIVASIFRVPTWRLEEWVRVGVTAPVEPKTFRRNV